MIVIPVFNDWESIRLLLPALDDACSAGSADVRVLLVDDGSNEPAPERLERGLTAISSVDLLRLRRNVGHQRAIAIGLYEVETNMPSDAVLVMDGDGEDRPSDVPVLLERFERCGRKCVVFAARTRRLERPLFRFFYQAYRVTHWMLTGIQVRVGNFSVVPRDALTRLMAVSDLWNHYAAAIYRARIPHELIPLARGRRLQGSSRMNFFGLLIHGLSAISVFSDIVSVRLLTATLALIAITLATVGAVAAVQLGAGISLPSWTAIASGIALVLLLQALTFSVLLVFTIISGRSNTSFLPLRDSAYFILDRYRIFPAHD